MNEQMFAAVEPYKGNYSWITERHVQFVYEFTYL